MKKILLTLLTLLSFVGFAQQKGEVVLEWTEKSPISFGTYSKTVPQFQSGNFLFDSSKKELFFVSNLRQTSTVDENSLQISNIVYESITAAQLGDLDVRLLPATIRATLKNVIARDQKFAFLSLSPIIKEANGFKKIKSFSYSFNNGTSRIAAFPNNIATISSSVLASGDWYRFYVEKSGVYKISKGFLRQLGLKTDGDPRKIKIFGNGGRMLPLLNNTFYPFDLAENAIQFIGENDGVFNDEDYILFYAEGVENWNDDSKTHNNLYASKSYYYVTTQANDGKRIQELQQPAGTGTVITTFDDYQFHEVDLVNFVRTGRTWLGEQFNIDDEQEFKFDFPNIVPSSAMTLIINTAAAAFTGTSFTIEANNQPAGTINLSSLVADSGIELYQPTIPTTLTIPAAEKVAIKLTYNNNGVPSSKGFLDYIILKAIRNLQGYGKQFRFQYDDASSLTGIGEYQFSNAATIQQVWDITDIYDVTKMENNGQSSFSMKADLGEVRKYIAVDAADYYTPLKESQPKVVNQDLKGTIFKNASGQFQDIDYIIVTPAFLNNQAEKLANFHRVYSQLNVKVVNLEAIYQEFSSGKQDIGGIRNFIKYVFENASAGDKRIKYLNLFGDASFDYKNRTPNNTNTVPIYHALNSTTAGESSFATDDFFTLMDADEGRIDYQNQSGNTIHDFGGYDIAVGRMIVSSTQQAEEMVNKVIEYHDLKSYGNWRNNCVFISDDSDVGHSDGDLQQRQNQLADRLSLEKPFINVKKIILDSYVQETSSGGNRYPKAREEIFNAFEKGALVFNYLGHGGEDGLSDERIWEKSDGQNLSNRFKYPLFITITCDFSRFDNPYRPTAGEYTFWNPKGGAISMITTIRSIQKGAAESFNDLLTQNIFAYGSNNYPSMAEALRLSKNISPSFSSNVVFYLGDPAVMLSIPKPKIRLTKVNDMPVTGPIDDFQSLAYVKLSGEITDEFNTPLTNYTGELSVNIFDKNITKTTFNNDGTSNIMNFSVLGETVFRGNASVANGQFEFGFVVPRDIRIPVGNGRISFYAKTDQTLLDKTGYDTTIKIGGINPNAIADNIGPRVKLFMNDQTFISGGITNESPIFLAYLEDENGINTASGIGHDIVAILDGNESNPYILNDYYETELDNYKKGKLQFPLRNLAAGLHTITFKAWDVYNNPISADIQFLVVGDDTITLTNVLNYPNPFVNYTQFWFTHNRPFEPLEVQVQVMTITGKVVWSKNQIITTDGFLSREITWDGKDDFGDKIGKGVYVYKLTVKSTLTNKKTEKFEKLVIL
ncbi:type IX secretion system sortase PorU [Flavobacterium sp. GT3R68]|uniref:type IX secretion system sortase PorU n=1 Tax=Flavobacterium sp. GT3R68 TaxID=2594437 RepID=UPI000F866C3A|nr:type IX secretion system sortase PorU [Flavobacterium sp. GT3R68]RTY86597.1 type IX secretion system sortase PorU [Flavobacterium sp. GSN2]TRW92634.1 type IX secretion system sortase PorU [Flavobacterium sp. GT3R68]